jgi:O-antigen ligase
LNECGWKIPTITGKSGLLRAVSSREKTGNSRMNHAALENDAGVLTSFLLSGSFLFLTGLSIMAVAGQSTLAMCLAPLPLLMFRFNSFHFMILYSACNLFFFPVSLDSSNIYIFQIADSCLIIFLACYFFQKKNFFSFTVPINSLLLSLYLFLAYVMILSIQPLLTKGFDKWLLFDIKRCLTLGLTAFFCTQPLFGPKKIVSLLLFFVLFTSLNGLMGFIQFLSTQERFMTWNEIYFGNIFIVCLVMLTVIRNKKYQLFLVLSAAILFLSMLATETRSIWIPTALCSFFYVLYMFRLKMKTVTIKKIVKVVCLLCGFLLLIDLVLRITVTSDLGTVIVNRMASDDISDVVNPFTSVGYRLYESLVVWKQKTFWGHGTGAYLYLYETQLFRSRFIYWWSIHSEYMEILHKWGFFGLGLYLLFIGIYLNQSMKLLRSKKKVVSAFGAIAFFTFLNTLLVSVTSGYMMREHMIIWVILMIGCVSYYRSREFFKSPNGFLMKLIRYHTYSIEHGNKERKTAGESHNTASSV